MGVARAAEWVTKLAQRGAGSTANKTKSASKLTGSGKVSKVLARGVKGASAVVLADYVIDVAVNEAATYSDFVDRNKEEVKAIVGLALLLGASKFGSSAKTIAQRFANRWSGRGEVPALFPITQVRGSSTAIARAFGSLDVSLVGGEVVVKQGRSLLGRFYRVPKGKRTGLAFAGVASLGGGLALLDFGQSATQVADDDLLLDIKAVCALVLAKIEYDAAIASAANLLKTFDPLDLIGSPRYCIEVIMQQHPDLDVESVLRVLDSVKYLVEEDKGNGLWYVAGDTELQPVVSFCGRLIAHKDSALLPAGGVMLPAPAGKWVQERAILSAFGACLTDMTEFGRGNGTLPLFQAVFEEGNHHRCFQAEQEYFVSEVFSSASHGVVVSVQVVKTGSSVLFITDGFADLGEPVASERWANIEKVLLW